MSRPAFEDMPVPYAVGIVAMDEGWHLMTNIVGCEVNDLATDMPLQVRFERVGPNLVLPFFEPEVGP